MTSSDSSAPPPADVRAVGSCVAGCGIEAVLHVGPVCTVYRVRCEAQGPGSYALKEYCPQALCGRAGDGAPQLRRLDNEADRAAFAAGRTAFLDEARMLARRHLPGLVPVLQVIDADAGPCLLMPLLPGVSLDQLPQPKDDVALHAQLMALLEPLAQLHAAGLVHGALHARQLLWEPTRPPVLLGFGLAARALGLAQVPQGLPPELQPEHGRLQPGPWTDVHALAAMVLHRLSGRPWEGAGGDEVAARLEQALGPARVAEQRHLLARALKASLAAAPVERPAHAGILHELLGGGPSGPCAPRQPAPETEDHAATAAPRPPRAGSAAHPPAVPAFAADAVTPGGRPGDAFTLPVLPRRRSEGLRSLLLGLLLGVGCIVMGWWVRGLWLQEQERHRMDQLIVGAADPVPEALPDGDADVSAPPSVPAPPSLDAGVTAAGVLPVAEGATAAPALVAQAPLPTGSADAEPSTTAAVESAAAAAPAAQAVAQAPSPRLTQPVAERPPGAAPSRAAAPAPTREARATRSARAESKAAAVLPVRAGAPRTACNALAKYALLQCMQQQCSQAAWRRHPQCLRLHRDNVIGP